MAKCKLEQCINCKKTFSSIDGNIATKICFTCEGTVEAEKAKRNEGLKGVENFKRRKKSKPSRVCKGYEKLAAYGED